MRKPSGVSRAEFTGQERFPPQTTLRAYDVLPSRSLPGHVHVGCGVSAIGVATRPLHGIRKLWAETPRDADDADGTTVLVPTGNRPGIRRSCLHATKGLCAEVRATRDIR